MLKKVLILFFAFTITSYSQIYSFGPDESLEYKISYGINIGEIKLDVAKKKTYII